HAQRVTAGERLAAGLTAQRGRGVAAGEAGIAEAEVEHRVDAAVAVDVLEMSPAVHLGGAAGTEVDARRVDRRSLEGGGAEDGDRDQGGPCLQLIGFSVLPGLMSTLTCGVIEGDQRGL